MRSLSWQEASTKQYDVIIVGSGFAGSILAKQLQQGGKRVLILEAGAGAGVDYGQHLSYVRHFMSATAKTPNSPFPASANAPQPEVTDVEKITPGQPSCKGYFVQMGPQPFESNYTRRLGGTSLHWFGSCPRMLPQDFRLYREYGVGVDWPLDYDELEPYYRQAEAEIGVAAEVEEQAYLGIHFPADYVYPMHRIPPSYLDQWMQQGLRDYRLEDGQRLRIQSIPQARNSLPNAGYNQGRGYRVQGAAGNPGQGQRCMGNSSCIPICPIQARYNSLKTLAQTEVEVLTQAVASQLELEPGSGRVTALQVKYWATEQSSDFIPLRLSAPWIVLAANAIENATLLQASAACGQSGELGRNLMDHPAILSWGLAPQSIGAFRGPGLTSTLVNYRGGDFRRQRAAFVLEIGNWGWSWPFNEPNDSSIALIEQGCYGRDLRQRLAATLPRQIRLDMMTEQLPSRFNRVEIDPRWRDRLGNYRPVLHYQVDHYSQAGMVFARQLAVQLFRQLGIEDYSQYQPSNPGYFEFDQQGYSWSGVGHVAGTHRMGKQAASSVVNSYQQAWQHPNLYVIGCGSMPTLGTSNPTLTMTALTLRTAQHLLARSS